MRKQLFALLFLIYLISSSPATSIDFNTLLGFNGLFREDSWTPLQIRLQNNGSSFRGDLVVITDNSSTTKDQIREYRKPIDLSSGASKTVSFTIPIGHHNRDLLFYIESEGELILKETIELKQRGIRDNFILSISPYPDLDLDPGHPVLKDRVISFPHPDLLPESSFAYDSVDIVSIHREYYDNLSNRQFDALTGWISQGGVLLVWGGKSPAQEKRNYLPCTIEGLERTGSVLVNRISIPDEYKLDLPKTNIDAARRKTGAGTVFFFPFDYSGPLRTWSGLNEIWKIANSSSMDRAIFTEEMDSIYLLENYITMFDASGFNYLGRLNAALIMFLSASITVSLVIFLRLRRKSKNLYKYLVIMVLSLISASALIFILLYNNSSRNECFALDINILYQEGETDLSRIYKDLLIGSSAKTDSRITFTDMTNGILKRDDSENLRIIEKPEMEIKNLTINSWSSEIFRLEDVTESLCDISLVSGGPTPNIKVRNKSEVFLRDAFILVDGDIFSLGSLLPGSTKEISLSETITRKIFHDDPLLQDMASYYTNLADLENTLLFGAFTSEDLYPLSFSNRTWKKRSETLILNSIVKEENLNG